MITLCWRVRPEELWGRGNLPGTPAFTEETLTSHSWSVDWSVYSQGQIEEMFFSTFAEDVEFQTSGSTGEPVRWLRTPRQLWAEAGAVAELVSARNPQALMSFASPSYLHGAIATATLAARLRVPMWYVAPGDTVTPMGQGKRWVVAAISSTYALLRRKPEWVEATRDVTMLQNTAVLPQTAAGYLSGYHPGRLRLVQVLGSTETGVAASRVWDGDEDRRWDLLPDVAFAGSGSEFNEFGERPLSVTSPRLARSADGEPLTHWTMDEYVCAMGERGFVLRGTRGRLV
jgi:hypothetical protein